MKSPCTRPNCSRPRKRQGLCEIHHWRKVNDKDMDAPIRAYRHRVEGQPCSVVGCKNLKGRSSGLCETHHKRKEDGDPFWSRRISHHRPAHDSADVRFRVSKRLLAKLKARAQAGKVTVGDVARGVLEVSL